MFSFKKSKKSSQHTSHKRSAEDIEAQEYEEYMRLKEKFEAEEYDDEDYDEEFEEDDEIVEDEEDSEDLDEELEEDDQDIEEEPEEELTEEEIALYEAAEAYYEAGCDGECDDCEHYDYCPAEEEVDPDDVEVVLGMTKGDIKETARGSVYLARESAMAAKELKEAMDDIMGGLDVRNWLK